MILAIRTEQNHDFKEAEQQEAQLSPRYPRDARAGILDCQLKCYQQIVRITQSDRVCQPETSRSVEKQFLPRDAMLARYMLSSCVCPSVRLSYMPALPKRLNEGSRNQRHTIAHGL